LGKLLRITEQIEQNLTQAQAIQIEVFRQIGRQFDLKDQAFEHKGIVHQQFQFLHQAAQIGGL
jgi:hypothetical protein